MGYTKRGIFFALVFALLLSGCGDNSRDGRYKIIDKSLITQSYGIGFRQGDEELCDTLAAAMHVLMADGTAKELSSQFIGGRELSIEADASALDDMEIEPRTLLVGMTGDRPPMAYTDIDGKFTGFDVKMAEAACRLLGWEVDFWVIEFDEQVELESGNVDCIWGGFTLTESLRKQLTCSEPYLSYDQVLMTRNGGEFNSYNSLKGETIAVTADAAATVVLSLEEPVLPKNSDTREFESYDASIAALDSGEVQGVLISSISAEYYAR